MVLVSPLRQLRLQRIFKMRAPLMLRFKGTVILQIWWHILVVVLYTAGIVYLHTTMPELGLNIPDSLISILGVVIGLLLVFRTDTAYDRYWEGRKIWSDMTIHIRTLTRCIWIGVAESDGRHVIEKRSAINLLISFVFATKHYLREEYSSDFDDIKPLLYHLRKFSLPSSNLSMKDQRKKKVECRYTAHDYVTPSNIPLELHYYISSYVNSVNERNLVEPFLVSSMEIAVSGLVNCLTGFERILRTPIPLAYSVHLHHSTWLYILALPFQLVESLNWCTVPVVGLTSFFLLGILSIGWEIENPFGYDANDLPLDDFCQVLRQEITAICERKLPSPSDWIFSHENHPLSPQSGLSAEMLAKKSVQELYRIMGRGKSQYTADLEAIDEGDCGETQRLLNGGGDKIKDMIQRKMSR